MLAAIRAHDLDLHCDRAGCGSGSSPRVSRQRNRVDAVGDHVPAEPQVVDGHRIAHAIAGVVQRNRTDTRRPDCLVDGVDADVDGAKRTSQRARDRRFADARQAAENDECGSDLASLYLDGRLAVRQRIPGTPGIAIAIFIGLTSVLAGDASGQNRPGERDRNYSTDAREHGYEHGYRDGADSGRQDRERGFARATMSANEYREGSREYDPSYGDRRQFMQGYRQGFQAGYDDGYNFYERPGRYDQVYGRREDNARSRASTSRDSTFDDGYRQGITAGQQDVRQNTRSDYRRSRDYQRGDQNYQDGFERGYQDGYGRSRFSSDGGGYYPSRGNTGPADTRDGQGTPTRTITVPANQLWTPTGIRVNQGDRLQIQASGQISLRPNDPKDVAIPPGSLQQRYAPNSPMPRAFAGALIGRIDSGQPFGIGNQTSIVAPASGMLYLGVNDDVVSDNSGQFSVTISW